MFEPGEALVFHGRETAAAAASAEVCGEEVLHDAPDEPQHAALVAVHHVGGANVHERHPHGFEVPQTQGHVAQVVVASRALGGLAGARDEETG